MATARLVSSRTKAASAFFVVLLAAAIAVGLFARFADLGNRPLAVDEYFSVVSIEAILAQGVPEIPAGGYYVRGPLFQYLAALAAMLFGENEFSYRLIPALFSLGSVVLAYLYARRFLPLPMALAVAAVLLVSSWHVEFARFARMYMPLQFMTLLYLLVLDHAFFGDKWRWRYLPHGLLLLAILTHDLAVLLAPLLFLPLLLDGARFPTRSSRAIFAAAGLATTALAFAVVEFNFRDIGVSDPYPPGYVFPLASSTGLVEPSFPFWRLSGDPINNLILLGAVVALGATVLLWIFRHDSQTAISAAGALALVVLSLAHLLVPYAMVLAVMLFRYRVHRVGRHARAVRWAIGATLAVAAAWLAYGLLVPEILVEPPPTRTAAASDLFAWARSLQLTFFAWPDLYGKTLRPFLLYLPVIGLLAGLALVYFIVARLSAPLPEILRHPGVVIVMTMLAFGLFQTLSSTTRYWFHLYPVVLCLVALAINEIAQRLLKARGNGGVHVEHAAALVFLAAFAISADFNPSHLARVASAEVGFRLGEFEPFQMSWMPHPDYRSPAEFLDQNAEADEASRIVVVHQPPVSYYLDLEHAVFFTRDSTDFWLGSRERGTLEFWSDMRLVSTPEELAGYTEPATEVWVVQAAVPSERRLDLEAVWADRAPEMRRMFLSEDGRIEVIRAKLAPSG